MSDRVTAHPASGLPRLSGPFATTHSRRRYRLTLLSLALLAVVVGVAVVVWDNPMPLGSEGFWTIARMRGVSVVIIAVVAFCQAIATVSFQTAANNRIITPGIMGFESLYTLIQTTVVFMFGIAGIVAIQSTPMFLAQVALMVVFAAALYGWLLAGRNLSLQVTLLIGIVLGGGLGALSTFMRRLLTPAEFDVLTARLIGSIANADASYLHASIPLAALAGGALWLGASKLNLMGLGRPTAISLGLNHRRTTLTVLLLVSVLMAVSTSLVGPMTFFGFLTAMLSYQLADTYDHYKIFPIAILTGFVVLAGGYLVLKNVFYAQGAVGIVIEIVGGLAFLTYVLRKGRL